MAWEVLVINAVKEIALNVAPSLIDKIGAKKLKEVSLKETITSGEAYLKSLLATTEAERIKELGENYAVRFWQSRLGTSKVGSELATMVNEWLISADMKKDAGKPSMRGLDYIPDPFGYFTMDEIKGELGIKSSISTLGGVLDGVKTAGGGSLLLPIAGVGLGAYLLYNFVIKKKK